MAFFHCMFYGRFFQFSRQEYGLHLPRFLCHFLINYQFLSQNTILTTTGQPFDKRLINFSIFRIIVCLSILLNKGVPKFDKLFFVFLHKAIEGFPSPSHDLSYSGSPRRFGATGFFHFGRHSQKTLIAFKSLAWRVVKRVVNSHGYATILRISSMAVSDVVWA